jgi:hypothetical protein
LDNSIQKPPFLLETRDFQISLCGNPVSNRRTPKTPLKRNCSDTKKETAMPECAVIYIDGFTILILLQLFTVPKA